MGIYLAPTSSLGVIHYLRTTNGDDGLGGTGVRRKTLNGAINTMHDLNRLDETAHR